MAQKISRKIRKNRQWRPLGVGLLALVLLIPLQMVENVVRERHGTFNGVLSEIAGLWSGEQTLTGPFLVLPYSERYQILEDYRTESGEIKSHYKWIVNHHRAVLLPKTLEISGALEPEIRRRGIYEARVYENELSFFGQFSSPEAIVRGFARPESQVKIAWDKAAIVMGLSEPKGIVRIEDLNWQGRLSSFSPGTLVSQWLPRGFHAVVQVDPETPLTFETQMAVRGSGGFRFTPVGERTIASMGSSWTHPSFYGDLLPADYETTEQGFEARWDLSHLIRSYPQSWIHGDTVDLSEVTSGVRLFEPVTLYAKVTRSVKYGFLFIALTFLTLGLVEMVLDERIRSIQYLLIGLALALFFMILVAFGEHLGFRTSYLIAASTVVGLNGLYSLAVLPRKSLALLVAAVLAGLYGVLYTILQAEDYALLGGTLLLVVALASTMFFTRHLHHEKEETVEPELPWVSEMAEE